MDGKGLDTCKSLHMGEGSPVAKRQASGQGHGCWPLKLRELRAGRASPKSTGGRGQCYRYLPHEAAEIQKGKCNSVLVTERQGQNSVLLNWPLSHPLDVASNDLGLWGNLLSLEWDSRAYLAHADRSGGTPSDD